MKFSLPSDLESSWLNCLKNDDESDYCSDEQQSEEEGETREKENEEGTDDDDDDERDGKQEGEKLPSFQPWDQDNAKGVVNKPAFSSETKDQEDNDDDGGDERSRHSMCSMNLSQGNNNNSSTVLQEIGEDNRRIATPKNKSSNLDLEAIVDTSSHSDKIHGTTLFPSIGHLTAMVGTGTEYPSIPDKYSKGSTTRNPDSTRSINRHKNAKEAELGFDPFEQQAPRCQQIPTTMSQPQGQQQQGSTTLHVPSQSSISPKRTANNPPNLPLYYERNTKSTSHYLSTTSMERKKKNQDRSCGSSRRRQRQSCHKISSISSSKRMNIIAQSQHLPTPSNKATSHIGNNHREEEEPPPFLLFDAPCELRTSFIQSQKLRNLPISNDNNSYHYGMAVNGFHPQWNAQLNPIIISPQSTSNCYDKSTTATSTMNSNKTNNTLPPGTTPIRLVDGRHQTIKSSEKERNEREQRRAQRITDLIETLRLSMVQGGWKVEMKSKFHTLSTCANYVRHLSKMTQNKEEAIEKVKADLIIREQEKMEEHKSKMMESRSDPESTTSSHLASHDNDDKDPGNTELAAKSAINERTDSLTNKKTQKVSHISSSSTDSSSTIPVLRTDDDNSNASVALCCNRQDLNHGNCPENIRPNNSIMICKDSSSREDGYASVSKPAVPDIIAGIEESSRESTTHNFKKKNSKKRIHDWKEKEGEWEQKILDGGISIIRKKEHYQNTEKRHRSFGHNDDTPQQRKKQKLDTRFKLDYEDVFLTSNVPQLIASAAGRIVTWNIFFQKVTGLCEDELKRLTIFSLVQVDELSVLFELVADALKKEPPLKSSSSSSSSNSSSLFAETIPISKPVSSSSFCCSDSSSTTTAETLKSAPSEGETTVGVATTTRPGWYYSAVTLPCVEFPAFHVSEKEHNSKQQSESNKEKLRRPLYMTVTLIDDEDPRKRCFHCVLTENSGTKGALTTVTPNSFAMLFRGSQEGSKGRNKQKQSNIQDTDVDEFYC